MRVCIIGAGLSGLTLAKALVNQKIFVHLFEEKKPKAFNQSRTLGISKSNVEFFNKNIIDINKIIWKLKEIEIFSDNLKNEKLLYFKNAEQELFSIVRNFQLIQLLNQKVNNNKFKHPATRVFQALRIYINEELNELEEVLKTCIKILNKKSRIIVVAFHSLEDRIIKNFFRDKSLEQITKDKKILGNEFLKIITKKPLTPSFKEIKNNPRSRSAKLRVAEKV